MIRRINIILLTIILICVFVGLTQMSLPVSNKDFWVIPIVICAIFGFLLNVMFCDD